MKHMISTRWLANPNAGRSHFHHNLPELVSISWTEQKFVLPMHFGGVKRQRLARLLNEKLFCFLLQLLEALSTNSTLKHQNCDLFKKIPGWRTNRLSLRNNRLKFTTSGKLSIALEESYEIYLKLVKENWKLTCNWLDLETLGFWPIMF